MRITSYGHSCLHIREGDASVLIDPGGYSSGHESLTGLTAILVTHQHGDHADPGVIAQLLHANPDAELYAEAQAATVLSGKWGEGMTRPIVIARPAERFDVGVTVEVVGGDHAIIHRDIPRVGNVGFILDGRLYHPGDALFVPDVPVEVLALPAAAPWMATKEAIDYLRRVDPAIAFPIHDAILSAVGREVVRRLIRTTAPQGCRWIEIEQRVPIEV